jgi:hypothetical protein
MPSLMEMELSYRRFRVKGSILYSLRGSNGQLTQSGIGCIQHGAQQGQLTRSRSREYGCGNRGQSDIMVSYGRDLDDDGAQRSK